MMNKWIIQIEVELADNLIYDGADAGAEWRLANLERDIEESYPFAYDEEVGAKASVISAPSEEELKVAMDRYEVTLDE